MWKEFMPLTSQVDWCEKNYDILPIVAEFWNTVRKCFWCLSVFCLALICKICQNVSEAVFTLVLQLGN